MPVVGFNVSVAVCCVITLLDFCELPLRVAPLLVAMGLLGYRISSYSGQIGHNGRLREAYLLRIAQGKADELLFRCYQLVASISRRGRSFGLDFQAFPIPTPSARTAHTLQKVY